MNGLRAILHVEDSPDDAELVAFALRKLPFKCGITRIDNEGAFTAALAASLPDLVICDYELPQFSAPRALALLRERVPHTPFLVVSHHVGVNPDLAVPGATAFVAKGDLARLPQAVVAALADLPPRK